MKQERKTLAKASDDYLKLVGLVEGQLPGVLLSYKEVEKLTGVKMDAAGKDKFRRAILRSHREYSVLRGVGYKLADTGSAVYIVTDKLQRITNATNRGERAYSVLNEQFGGQLEGNERKYFIFVGNIYGAIRLATEQSKKLYSQKQGKVLPSPQNIDLPNNL